MTTAIEQTLEIYGIENWSAGYFDVNRKGNLIVRPVEGDPRSADLKEIIDDLAKRGITAPVLLRFPQLVAAQVEQGVEQHGAVAVGHDKAVAVRPRRIGRIVALVPVP